MKKIVFIVPYYGKFPGYFQEWVYSAGYLGKQNIDFLLITDIKIDIDLPENIYVKTLSFDQFKKQAQEKFDFEICLPTPYNLCDFKPALGYIFQEDIAEYDFWGNCDIDQVWGDVRNFTTDDILEKFDRIQYFGHFILYRNRKDINELFKLPGAIYDYRTVYSSTMHYSFCEQSGMMRIVEKNNISNYTIRNYADISPYVKRMMILGVKNFEHQIIFWHQGKVIRAYIDNNEVKYDEFMYFHFQKKNPKTINAVGKKPDAFMYTFDGFKEIDVRKIDRQFIIDNCDFISNKQDDIETRAYIKTQLKKFFSASWKAKVLWIKQRIATRQVYRDHRYFN